jgi:hypothetical protein
MKNKTPFHTIKGAHPILGPHVLSIGILEKHFKERFLTASSITSLIRHQLVRQ